MDWSFLFEPHGIDKFVEDLFAFDVIVFESSQRLPRVIRMNEQTMSVNGETELFIANGRDDESSPWFRIVFKRYSESNAVNKSLEAFFMASGILGVHARCDSATVMAMMDKDVPDSYVDVPALYYQHAVPSAEVVSIPRDETLARLESIPGELVWRILHFLRHPTAQLIFQYWNLQSTYWDRHFQCMASRTSAW